MDRIDRTHQAVPDTRQPNHEIHVHPDTGLTR